MWETGGHRAGERASGRPGRRGRERPHTRHCLDAAIIVSSEHPGSAGSAERELNKEERGEESREKSARGAGSWPAGFFLCPATLLCAPLSGKHCSEMPMGMRLLPGPEGQARVTVWVWGARGGCSGGECILHRHFLIWRAVAVGTKFLRRQQNPSPSLLPA